MAWWTLLPAAVGMAATAINKPKREDYKTDVSSYQRYIANLYNQVGKRDVYRQAMEPGLRAGGRAASQSRREMGYELSRMGMADSGAAVQANLSLTDKYLQQVGDIASQAIAQEEEYRRRALGEASRVESQIGQIKAQDKQSYERARSQWTSDMIGQALGLGASAIAQGLQTSQYKKELLAAADVADEIYGLAGTTRPVAEPQPTTAQSPAEAFPIKRPYLSVPDQVQKGVSTGGKIRLVGNEENIPTKIQNEPSRFMPGRIGPTRDEYELTGNYDMSPKVQGPIPKEAPPQKPSVGLISDYAEEEIPGGLEKEYAKKQWLNNYGLTYLGTNQGLQEQPKAGAQMQGTISISEGMSKIMDKYPNMSPQFYQNAMSTLVERKAQEKNVQNTMTYVNAMRDILAGEPVNLANLSDSLSPQMTISLAEAQMAQDPAIKTKKIVDSFMKEGLDPNMFEGVKDVNEAVNLVHQNTLKLYAEAIDSDSGLALDDIINNDTVPMDARIKAMELVAKNQGKGHSDAFVGFLETGMDIEQIDKFYPAMTEDEQTDIKDMIRLKNEKTAGGINGDNIKDIIYDYSLVLKSVGEIKTAAEMESDEATSESYKASADKLYQIASKELDKLYEYQELTEMGINLSYGQYQNLKSDIKTLMYEAYEKNMSPNEALRLIMDKVKFIPEATLRKWINE